MTGPLDIETSARLAGAHRWVEQRLFEILGTWSALVTAPEVQVLVGRQSHHHAWHAELWAGCLPALPHLRPDDVTAAPSPALAEVLDAVADPDDAQDAAGKLVGVARVVVPHLRAAYARRLARATPVADGPVIRAIGLIDPDLASDGDASESRLQALLASAGDARRLAERQGRLEAQLLEAGGIP